MRLNIKTKIILSTFAVVAVSLVACGFFTYNYFTGILKEQSIRDNTTNILQISQQLKMMQEQIKKTATYVITDEDVGELIGTDFKDEINEYYVKVDVAQRLTRFGAISDYVSDIIIIREDGNIFSNTVSFENYYREIIKEPWYEDFIKQGKKTGFTSIHNVFIGNVYEDAFSYITRYESKNGNSTSKYTLVFDIKCKAVNKIFEKSASDFEKLMLINGDSGMLYNSHPGESEPQKQIIEEVISSKKDYVEDRQNLAIADVTLYDGWKQVAIISKARLFDKVKNIFPYFFVITMLSLIFIIILIIPIVMNITKPLSRLVEAMKKVSRGDFDTKISVKTKDEFEIIGEGFNKMVGELNDYIKVSLHNEKMKRKMQIDLLISQINPHFIYNTLNSVIYLTHAGRNGDAIKITESIISILQDTVKTGEDAIFALVREELKIVDNYINIQKYRYPHKFDVEIKLEGDMEEVKMPRMALQPIVENALFHGIYPSDSQGILKIHIWEDGGKMYVCIEDNGVGMDEETLKNIYKAQGISRASNHTRSIGLRNVRERLAHLYESEAGIEILSRTGEGTRVVIHFPVNGAKSL